MLHPGLYEQVINSALNSELSTIPEARKGIAPIDKAEASKVLAQYLADVVQKALDNVIDNGGDVSAQIALTNQIVDLIQTTTKEDDFASMSVDQRAEQLLALTDLTVEGVAQSCGYSDPLVFSKLFKKRTGQTPSAYRRENWERTKSELSGKQDRLDQI